MVKNDRSIEEANLAYKHYIEEHKNNIKTVWNVLQDHLKGRYWLDEHTSFNIETLIEEHDQSKFDSFEFEAYQQVFFPIAGVKISKEAFEYAVNKHLKSNPHHWEYWVILERLKPVALDMYLKFIIEMLCDWSAMSLKFNDTPSEFYQKNKENFIFHEKTKVAVEYWLPVFNKVIRDIRGGVELKTCKHCYWRGMIDDKIFCYRGTSILGNGGKLVQKETKPDATCKNYCHGDDGPKSFNQKWV